LIDRALPWLVACLYSPVIAGRTVCGLPYRGSFLTVRGTRAACRAPRRNAAHLHSNPRSAAGAIQSLETGSGRHSSPAGQTRCALRAGRQPFRTRRGPCFAASARARGSTLFPLRGQTSRCHVISRSLTHPRAEFLSAWNRASEKDSGPLSSLSVYRRTTGKMSRSAEKNPAECHFIICQFSSRMGDDSSRAA